MEWLYLLIQDRFINVWKWLSGVEVYHPSHDKRDSNEFYNLAKKYKLTITGGSDFHGGSTYKENNIGSYGLDEIMLDKFMKSFK